jgi:ATP-dependent Clp protease ATP-binding subunit ClpC
MHGIKSKFEDFHGVVISDAAIEKSITYSVRYIMNKHLPDKAIDIIDEACARVSTLQAKLEVNSDYVKVQKRIESLQQKIEKSIEKQDYFQAAEYKEKEEDLKKKLKNMRQQNALPKHLRPVITEQHV